MKLRIALTLMVASLSASANFPRQTSAPTPEGSRAVRELRFEIASNKPWVEVRINGSAPQWFILDTGCRGTSTIARASAERLHLKLGDETQASVGAGEGVKVGFTTTPNVTLDVAGDALICPELGVFPFDHVEPYEGRAVNGLLGQDFMSRHVVEIDYAERRIRLCDPATYAYAGKSAPIPFTFQDGLVVVEATMTPPGRASVPCHVVIDTGVRTTVIWYRPFVLAHDLVASQPHVITATIGGGAGGETKGDIGRIESLKIGAITIQSPSVVFSRDTTGVFAGSEEDGIVGGEVLRRCKVTFDYPHQRLYLEPYESELKNFEYDMSGLFLVSPGPGFGHVMIQSVAEHTPAAEAGMAKGDEILSIDGRSIAGRTLDDLRELLKKDGTSYRIAVKRGDAEREVRLSLRRLV
jgi:hypothetical protein